MIITLTSDYDVLTFVQYLIHKNMLSKYFDTITIKEEDSNDYLLYIASIHTKAPIQICTPQLIQTYPPPPYMATS
jgi:hypothetical protein